MLEESKFKSLLKNQDKIIQNQYNLAEGLKKINEKIEHILENINKKKIEL
jgi:dephospho-CoA kinase